MSTILNGLLEYTGRGGGARSEGGSVKRESGGEVCLHLLSQWRELEGWWGAGQTQPDHQSAAINLLRRLLSVDPRVSWALMVYAPHKVDSHTYILCTHTTSHFVKKYILYILVVQSNTCVVCFFSYFGMLLRQI